MKLSTNQIAQIVFNLIQNDEDKIVYSYKELIDVIEPLHFTRSHVHQWFTSHEKVSHGRYNLSPTIAAATGADVVHTPKTNDIKTAIEKETEMQSIVAFKHNDKPKLEMQKMQDDFIIEIPKKNPNYVAWGFSRILETVLKDRSFFPVYIEGLSGNGKTFMVEQSCARQKREYVRVQITIETDEDDLIGGYRLMNGNTVFSHGPVVAAMKRGAVLLIDEIDRGDPAKLMALQGVLEGKPILIKKTGEVVEPAAGFTVIATANTKGRGSESGQYSSANIIDDALLERFVLTLEQPYPSKAVEKKIVLNAMKQHETVDQEYATTLVNWADAIRKTYNDGGIDDLISTRRLTHIVQTYGILKNQKLAVELCVSRFDTDIKEAFITLYKSLTDSTDEQSLEDVLNAASEILVSSDELTFG